MTDYGCDRTNIENAISIHSLLPSDVSVGPYTILDPCCNIGYVPMTLVTTLSGMAAYTSQEVTISGGCAPYKWEVSSAGLSFTSLYTTTPTNTLYYDGTVGTSAGAITVTDICSRQGSGGVTISSPIYSVEEVATGEPWALVFIANTADCYKAGATSSISITAPHTITAVSAVNAGCSTTGLNPAELTTPEDYDTIVSLSITMVATGYRWANGSAVYGTAVMSVEACTCGIYDGYIIDYITDNMDLAETQYLTTNPPTDLTTHECLTMELASGGGTFTVFSNAVRYKSASTNVDCVNNAIIVLKNDGVIIDTLKIGVSDLRLWSAAFATAESACADTSCYSGYPCSCDYRITFCDGTVDTNVVHQCSVCTTCGSHSEIVCGDVPDNGTYSLCAGGIGTITDIRYYTSCDQGCCPAELM